jgi:Protein of unknown function (DUF3455)
MLQVKLSVRQARFRNGFHYTRCKLATMITKLLPAFFLLAVMTQASAQAISRPDVPASIQAPSGQEIVLVAEASGSQIYTCQAGGEGKPAWTLKAPDAELRDPHGTAIGRQFAGPSWKLNDGSEVVGKAVARVDSPDANSIPWLLVNVTSHTGNGALSQVTSIQRIHTHGGQPPSAADCTPAKLNSDVKSSYTAEYYFYAPSK